MNSLVSRYKKQLLVSTFLFGVLFAFFVGVPHVAFAQDATLGLGGDLGANVNLGQLDLRVIIARIIQIVFGVLGTILLVIILYAGWLWMTSQGDEEKIVEAKAIIKNATIGLAIMLSAFSIASFIIRLLSDATGRTSGGITGRTPAPWEDFSGSGALGNSIADHYPFRDQKDVARNTKIIVTFKEAIVPESLIRNTNNDSLPLGVCGEPAAGTAFDWRNDCDQLNTSVVRIYRTNDDAKALVDAAIVASYEGGDVKTFVFRPYEYLGSDSEHVSYTVELTDGIKRKSNGESAFSSTRGGMYTWSFETGTTLDFTPPHVTETYPERGGTTARNYILQVSFDEPMDPTAVQGRWAVGSNFLNIVTQPTSSVPVTGVWKVSNGYKTVEFIPDETCGFNACGDVMYCLAIDRTSGCVENQCRPTRYQMLLRTATTIPGGSFEAQPFTGIMDVAGNALDVVNANGARNTREVPPPYNGSRGIVAGETVPDNYYWYFDVEDKVDTTAPFVHLITPSIDEENVAEKADLSVIFGRRMMYSSLTNLVVEEDGGKSPVGAISFVDAEGKTQTMDALWFSPRSGNVTTTALGDVVTTQTRFEHRAFGPNDLDLYYYTSIPSSVKSLNQNCMYPGRGPAPVGGVGSSGDSCVYEERNGVASTSVGCIDVRRDDAFNDTGCGYTTADNNTTVSSTKECLQQLRLEST